MHDVDLFRGSPLRALTSAFTAAVLILAIVGCSSERTSTGLPPEVTVDTIVLSPSPIVVHVSDYVFVTATAYDRNHQRVESPGLKWSIDDGSIAYVSIGLDTLADMWGRAVGATAISATFGGKTTRLEFPVLPMAVVRMFVAPGVAAVEKGGQRQLSLIEMNPHGMPVFTPTAVWSSSDSSVALVNQAGKVNAVNDGTVQIRATFDTVQASITLHVPTSFASVVAGDTHSCGLKPDGRVFCWGGNAQGQLGDGTLTAQFAPTQVKTSARFSSIYALREASCGLTSAGDLFCWGNNDGARLGIAGSTNVLTPTRVTAPEAFSQVAAGAQQICAIGISGKTYCWGVGSAAGSTTILNLVTSPTQIQTPLAFTSIAAGDQYTCALGTDHRAYCWGADPLGELGDSVPDHANVFGRATPAPVAGGHDFTAIFAGPIADNTCGIAVDGTSWCWGDYIESDAASTTVDCGGARCSPVPIRVSAPVSFATMTTGAGSVCALDTTGQAYCWGRGFNDLGSSFQSLSSKLQTNLRFNSIAAGFAHNCGLSLSNAIFCWGNNKDGQIGDYSAVAVPPSLYGKTVVVLPTLIAAP